VRLWWFYCDDAASERAMKFARMSP
jgi:hypothetical protein